MVNFVRAGIVLLAAALLAGCQEPQATGGRLKVVSTTGMIHDIAQQVGGDRVEAVGLMGPGIDPHLYKATAGDIGRLEQAQVIFYNGMELEGRMTDLFVRMSSKGVKVAAVTESMDSSRLREPEEFEGKFDPHVWFDVDLWAKAVENIRDTLSEADPEGKAGYAERAGAVLASLKELDDYVKQQAESVPAEQRILVTAHDAFGYFGARYGFEVLGIQGVSTASEATAQAIRSLADDIVKRRVRALFVESSVPPDTIEALKKAVESRGWQIKLGKELYSDALGPAGSGADTYEGMVRANIDHIVEALR
jgi:manganese/zinc/iron transport system substrate-binding protein